MQVSQKELVALFTALGARNAETWKEKDLQTKLAKVESLVDEDEELDATNQKLLDKILKAQKKGEEVTITMNGKKEDPPEVAAAKKEHDKKVKGKAPSKAKDEDEEEEEEEDEDEEEDAAEDYVKDDDEDDEEESNDEEDEDEEDEEVDEKPKKGKPAAKPPAKKPGKETPAPKKDDKKPTKKPGKEKDAPKKGKAPPKAAGVIQCIADIVSAATAKKPITKEQIHEKLCKRFPDRDSDSLKTTVGIQVPSRLNKEKNLGIKKNDRGYYVEA